MIGRKAALRAVESEESDAPRFATKGVRLLDDGSLEFGNEGNWSKLSARPIIVKALTRNIDGEDWGRLIEVSDSDGRKKTWNMPAYMLASRGEELLQALFKKGAIVETGPSAVLALRRYLASETSLDGSRLPRARLAGRTGWHGNAFALPERALGSSEQVVYESSSNIKPAIRQRGSLSEWQNSIGYFADGNSRLALVICAAFAAPLLKPLGFEGFAIHFRGGSSIGKTTALNVAGSAWGGPSELDGSNGYKQTWRATANGFEGLAEAHCDLPLCLDELGQIRGEHAAQVAYQLSGGLGTTRALKTGAAAARKEWRVTIISTGEISLGDKVREANSQQRIMAGQEVRFIDVPADAGNELGLFDWVPEIDGQGPRERSKDLSERLNRACQNHFGHAGPAFVEAFISNRDRSTAEARKIIAEFQKMHAANADGQVQRVANIFGLLAAAGELAISFGIVNWSHGYAKRAGKQCFNEWLDQRGGRGAHEIQSAMAHLRLMIEADGEARFQTIARETSGKWISAETKFPIKDRLGFRREESGDIEYLIQTETWKQIMSGRDASLTRELAARGILKSEAGRPGKKVRLPGFSNPQRVIAISSDALFADGDQGK